MGSTTAGSAPHLARAAAAAPDEAAAVFVAADGSVRASVTFADLDARSLALAAWLHDRGVGPGEVVGVVAGNVPELLEVAWAAVRSGLYVTAVNHHLRTDEVAYVVADSGARVVVTEPARAKLVAAAVGDDVTVLVTGAGGSYEAAIGSVSADELAAVPALEGDFMLYSSGTTGRPKGIKRPLPEQPVGEAEIPLVTMVKGLGFDADTVYLCPAPLYHAAPLAWSMATQRLGGTVVVLESFDAATALQVIDAFEVTHSQWVPTMFVRMLKLSDEVRHAFDGSSLRLAIHAAAPCPPDVKRRMIEWWGPILLEFYSATEGVGMTLITSPDWLEHPGSVGRAVMGTPHILDDDGREVPTGEIGTVWFSGGSAFTYHGDDRKTAAAHDAEGRATIGDLGRIDDEGYLYLAGRTDHMILCGGTNVYPQEVEDALISHPQVLDAAVVGAPDDDMGEVPVAFVEAAGTFDEAEVTAWLRERFASIKVPRSITLVESLPRTPTGKLRKHELPRA